MKPAAGSGASALSGRLQALAAKTLALTHRVTTATAYASGLLVLALGLFMTLDVLGRRFGGPFSGATDEIASYAMAFSATWALAFTLASGRHIRIDVLLPWLPAPLRRVVDYLGVAALGGFAALLAYGGWMLALESDELESRSMVLQLPLALPQAIVSAGFTLLALQALAMLLMAPFLPLDAISEQPADDSQLQGI
ncbi:MAG: TRAP transporter small permease [Rubrivivax sp.]